MNTVDGCELKLFCKLRLCKDMSFAAFYITYKLASLMLHACEDMYVSGHWCYLFMTETSCILTITKTYARSQHQSEPCSAYLFQWGQKFWQLPWLFLWWLGWHIFFEREADQPETSVAETNFSGINWIHEMARSPPLAIKLRRFICNLSDGTNWLIQTSCVCLAVLNV